MSFDFDSTLSRTDVQSFAKVLINKGYQVWICTSRASNPSGWVGFNDDLFDVASTLGISKERIIFTEYELKSEHLVDKDFIFHLDDDWSELRFINSDTKTIGIDVTRENWLEQVQTTLSEYND